MSVLVDDIVAFAAREGNQFIENQVNMKARLFAVLDKTPMKGKRAVINVIPGGVSSTTQVVDGGPLPSEDRSVPEQGFVDAVAYLSRLGLGRVALATLAGVEDSADLLDVKLQQAAEDMARQLGRAMYGNVLATPTAAASSVVADDDDAIITANFTGGLSDFREGEAYHYELDGYEATYLALCVKVTFVSDNVVTVEFIVGPNGVPGNDTAAIATELLGNRATVSAEDRFFLRGSRVESRVATTGVITAKADANPGLVSLSTITGSGSLHGISSGVAGWTGVSFAAGGAPTPELFLGRSQLLQARSGAAPTHLVLSNLAAASYAGAQIANGTFPGSIAPQGRRNVDGKLDKYGRDADNESGLAMFGRPVVIDANCPAAQAFLINKDYVKVGEWRKLAAEDEAGEPLLLSRSHFSKEVQFACIYNMICRKRNAHAAITGLTIA